MAPSMTSPELQANSEGKLETSSWLNVAAMLTELVFETDCDGRFSAFGPGKVLGQPGGRLLGMPVSSLFLLKDGDIDRTEADFAEIFQMVCKECIAWQGKVRQVRLSGAPATYRLALAPRLAAGLVAGSFGMLSELPEPAPSTAPGAAAFAGGDAPPLLDAETRFWTAPVFTDELARRFDRLDVEGLPGSLLFLGFSRAQPSQHGPIALRLADELRDIVRPTDLLGRIDATTIALWCDGMDHLTAAERAARFCAQLPAILPESVAITAGVVARWPGSADDPHTVMERAFVALRLADLATERQTEPGAAGAWRVWQQD